VGFGKGLEAIEQGAQGGQGVVRQEWGSQSEQQLAIRSVLGDLEGARVSLRGFWLKVDLQ
jgi:hypothetical protein